MIAALYIDTKGPYPKLDDVDCWDAIRDARKYRGPHPIVAHPPCRFWGRLRHLALGDKCPTCNGTGIKILTPLPCPTCKTTGRISDADCAPRAVKQIRAFGGVLEHPAGSKLWEACALPKPQRAPSCSTACVHCFDDFGGYTIELYQCEWGHVARKRTWLYLVGVPYEALKSPPYPGREPSHDVSRDVERAHRNGYTRKRTSSAMNLRTPPLFAEYLVRLAIAAGEARAGKRITA